MLSFKFILIAAAVFASVVSAVPTPVIDNNLNIAELSPYTGAVGAAENVVGAAYNAAFSNADTVHPLPGAPSTSPPTLVKRGGSSSSCKEVIQKSHDDIADIVVKIS